MESMRTICPSSDPFDQVIIETIADYIDGKRLEIDGERLYLYEEDIKFGKVYPNGSVDIMFIDEDGLAYRVLVRQRMGMPDGYWIYNCNLSKGEWHEF